MQNSLPKKAQSYLKEHLREKRWKQVVTVLACVVVFCTTYALILPALTMTGDTYCGKEAHQHSDECYEKVLVCGLEETEAAAVTPAHTHTDDCYTTQQVLSCGQGESAGHTHGDDCYDTDGNLVCGQEESVGHTHTEACYQEERILTCGQDEVTAPKGAESHVHEDSCYEKTLICQKEEHEHSLICYSNPDADVESASVWSRSVSKASLTGNWADDLVAVAQTQLGYAESTRNYMVTETGEMKGITRFGQWYGNPYGDWDAMFVSFCLNYAGIPQTAVPYGYDCAAWAASLSYAGLYRSAGNYSPIRGDIVFFDYNADGAADHVGLVAEVSEDGSGFKSVEGNMADCVQQLDHYTGESGIIGYAALPENPDYIPAAPDTPDGDLPADDLDTPVDDSGMPADVLNEDDLNNELQTTGEGSDVQTIAVGETKTIAVDAGKTVKLRFVPDYSHEYIFYSSTSGDTYGHLYDANGKQLTYNDDSAGNNNFKITYTLNGGETYYWGTRWYSNQKTGDITVHLELGTNHVYTKNEQGELVCTCGNIAPESGTCGVNLTWEFDEETGTLTIAGNGDMYNYSSSSKAPWAPISDLIKKVVIGENTTSVGEYAFQACTSLENVVFPSTLTKIGCNAFERCESLKSADLSATSVNWITRYAFQNCTSLNTVQLPEGLTGIGWSAFYGCRSLDEIDLSNTQVASIQDHAFYSCTSLKRASFPSTLTDISDYTFFNCGALTEIDLSGTGVTRLDNSSFASCTLLEKITLPETLTTISDQAFKDCTNLSEITIPKTVSLIRKDAFGNSGLTELRLEAADVTIDATQAATKNGFHVTVASTVDNLTADTIAALSKMGCNGMSFEGPNYLTEGNWQADFLPSQLNGLPQSEYFIDEQGVFYRIDSETNTASVFYCPPGISGYTIPKELPAIDGKEALVPVTGVDSYAFANASDLTTLTFEAPDAITTLADLAFYNAVNLASINGKSDAAAVLNTFTSDALKKGTMLFWQTKIADDSTRPSGDAITVEKEKLKLTVSTGKSKYLTPAQSEDGTYLYYTGEAAQTTVTVSNPDSAETDNGTVVRVYFSFDEKNGKLNYKPGTYTVKSTGGNEYTMQVVQTGTAGCYYAELERPKQGDTISIILESSYPSPTSNGGNATVWCDVLTKAEKDAVGNGLIPVVNHQSMNWSTVADTFPITKKENSTGSSKLVGDGTGSAFISGLNFKIDMSRTGTTLEGIGKDHMRSADFEDVLTLPEGVTLAEDVLKSIQDGTVKVVASYDGYLFQTAEGRTFLTITPSNNNTNYKYLQNGSFSLDEHGNPVVHWGFRNADLNTEIGNVYFNYKISDNTLIVAEPKADATYTVHNEVDAKQHFMYSADQEQKADCSVAVKKANSSLKMFKDSGSINGNYYGEPQSYIVRAENPGALPYENLAYLTDDLPTQLYMRPADIASMFEEDTEHQLTITIKNATICTPGNSGTVSGVDGSSATTNTQNTGNNTEYRGTSGTDPDTAGYESSMITIAWGENNQLQITVEGGTTILCAPEESAIRSVLDRLSLVVTPQTQYCLKWDLRNADGTVKSLPGGGKIQKNISCTYKDTFMLLSNDTLNEHPTQEQRVYNYAYGWDSDNKWLGSDYINKYPDREFYLAKDWSKNGQAIDSKTTIRQGDILDYSLNVTHSGKGQYDTLPLIDHMSGTQVLLVPVEKNSGAEWAQGLQTITDNGVEYYILDKPGTYHNAWTSESQLADTVEVTQSESGLDTLIKWYFANYTGNRTDTVTYRSYVCPDKSALSYSLGNESWLNDHQSHRLYATLPGWQGTSFDFDKVIVDSVGDTGTGYSYSHISEGQTAVYRLLLRSSTDKDGKELPMTITGKDMYDALPLSNDTYRWSKNNVRITYMDNYAVTNGDNWSVDKPEAGDQQYIKWADDFSMTFTGTAYIYVELDFPSDIPWQEYANKYATTTLVNTFYVLSAQRSVTHDVTIAAKVRLQKGVFDTGYYYDGGSNYTSDMCIQDDRLYYQNNDVKNRAVKYYVSLYNAGPTNLYLTDMQDLLPRGFTYSWRSSFTTTTYDGSSYYDKILKDDGKNATKMGALVTSTISTDENGRQRVAFHFAQTTSTSTSNPVSYDKDRDMCYLKPGQAIDFTYICKTNNAADTDDAALNIVTMPYYDFNNGGVVVDDGCKITSPRSDQYTPNDGGCDVWTNGEAENLGFTGGTNDTQWLTSEVTLIRGAIKPGITKALTSKTDQNGVTTQDPVSAAPTDTLNWTVKTENDGTNAISDYALTDRMQSPYMFTGKVSYTVYNAPDSNSLIAKPKSDYLFTIGNGTSEGTLSIRTNLGTTQTLTVGGDPVTLKCDWYYSKSSATSGGQYKQVDVQLSVVRDSDNNAVLSLHFPDETMAIPENGYSLLTLSTSNPTGILENKQFINTSFVTPMAQVWDGTANKGNVVTLETPFGNGAMPSVRNSAPITTSYGYVTGSSKQVTEVGNPDNTAACTGEPNYIVLGDKTKQFRYTLSVENSTPKAMDMFVLIDGLPEVGDHTAFLASDPRFSEFKVSLADNPDFSVTVTDKETKEVTEIDPGSYTIEYSAKTEFAGEDWKGTSQWSTSAENARSIRLKIFDQTGTLIPTGSTISLSFTCKIDDPNVQPGQIAWNSFGYHYSLLDEAAELEAAPLKVGVRIPSVPELRKQVVDHKGQPCNVEQDEAFSFLVYPGTALPGEYATREEIIAALGDTPYEEFSVTVKAGESLSESVRLQTDKWAWTEGQPYTVVELPCGESYTFKRFLNSTASSYTLTYTSAQTQIVTCENTNLLWSVELTKENTAHEPLSGAVFALYSPDESDKLTAVPTEYADLNVALTVEHNNKTWYLTSVQTTPEDGKLNWPNLLREEYYLLEVKAPNGYNLNSPAGQILKQENETHGVYSVTVVNRSGYSLPETGGTGTHLYALGGFLLLLSAGALFLYQRIRRRKEGGTPN